MVAVATVLTPLGWLVSPLITILFNKAHDHLGTGIDERRKILEATVLPRLSLVIEKVEKSPNKDRLVDWLNRLKGAYYEAEEAIDLFEYKQFKKQVKTERGTRISLPSQFAPRCLKIASVKLKYGLSIFSRQKIILKGCIDKLIEIAKEANEFSDLLEEQENASSSDADRDTSSKPPARVFGRDKDLKNIVGLLTKNPVNFERGPSTRKTIPIVSITGRSGVGKTALAQYVYEHMAGQVHFNLCVWVHAPRKFKAIDVIMNMIKIIMAKKGALYDCNFDSLTCLEAISTQITSMLRFKKLLLVLDDLWSDTEDFKDQWKKFIDCLSSCSPESKILLTTQSKNSIQKACISGVTEVEAYSLEEIEEGQFLELFMHYAWPNNSDLQKEEFKKIGQKIAVKLKRDPSTAKLVGCQLSEKLRLSDWKEAAEKDWSEDTMKAKVWSYQQLRLEYQRCFAICCLFPKGTILQRQCLINLWMAEGFIRATGTQERLEKIGEDYLHELVSRYFLEEVVFKEEICYQLHDLLHDLAEQVQGDDFIRIDSTNSREASHKLSRSENIRHIHLPSSMINELKENLCLMKNLYTFWVEPDGVVPKKELKKILKNFKKLRVLYLLECVDDLSGFIGKLKHLRLLHIGGSCCLKKLPDSICKLYHLQSLGLPNCESLPNHFSKLISLRYFETIGKTMSHISHVGRLTSLQGLDEFVVKKKGGNELHQLENLNMLRGTLRITGLENVRSTADAVKANMRNKNHLKELEFEWNSYESDISVQLLEALQPHPNISVLRIKGFKGDRFPNWLLCQNSLEDLTTLTLFYCGVEEISSIDKSLPSCTNLILKGLTNLKQMPSLPPKLTYLEIEDIPQLSFISEDDLLNKEERKKSKLEAVKQIAQCLKLEYVLVPENFGLTVRILVMFVREGLKAAPEITTMSSQDKNIFSEIVNFDPYNDDYSLDQLFDAWVMFMNYQIETMFNKNVESKLVLPYSLTYLKISFCTITSDALSNCIKNLVSLSKLELSNIMTITTLPFLYSLTNLQSLTIDQCYLLSSLGGIGALTSLIDLELIGCINLSTSNEPLPSSLERLKFQDCSNVDVILSKSNLPVLRSLYVWDITFKNQGGVLHVGHLSCLESLSIIGCDCHLEGLNSLTALYSIVVVCCPEINSSSPTDKYTHALQDVEVDNPVLLKLMLSNETISSIDNLSITSQEDSIDDEIFQSLSSLKQMSFYECNIIHLPKSLKNFASVQYMKLNKCPNLSELEELPQNLRVLEIKDCPTLREKFNNGGTYQVRFYEGSTIVTFPTQEERIHV